MNDTVGEFPFSEYPRKSLIDRSSSLRSRGGYQEPSTKRSTLDDYPSFYYRTVLRGGLRDTGGPVTPGRPTLSQYSSHSGPAVCDHTHFHPLMAPFADTMIVLTDMGFHAKPGDPARMQVCPRGTWNTRRLVAAVLSMLTTVFHSKKVGQHV